MSSRYAGIAIMVAGISITYKIVDCVLQEFGLKEKAKDFAEKNRQSIVIGSLFTFTWMLYYKIQCAEKETIMIKSSISEIVEVLTYLYYKKPE
jgi:hypothetical protein